MREFAWYYLWRLCQPDSMTMKHAGETMDVWKVAWSPDGKLLASAGIHSAVKLWDAATGRLRATLEHDAAVASAVAFSPDGKTLATGSAAAGGQSPQLKLWSMETHAPIASFDGHAGAQQIYSVAFSPDGKTLASSANDSTVRLWDVETGQPIATFPCDQPSPFAIAFSPDGTLLAVGGGHNDRLIPELKLWNTTTRRLQATLDGHAHLVCSVAFSPDGKTLASGGGDHSIILWDVGSGEITATITGHEDLVRDLAFTSDGVTLASASYDRTVRLWDTATGHELRRLLGHKKQARCVAFSPDNRWVLTGGGDGTVRLWGAAVDETRDTIRGQDALMSEVAFSPDGRQLVSGGKDAVRLWDVETAELRATFSGPEGGCEIVAFSPDGRKVAATGFGGAIKLRTPDPTSSRAPRLLDVSTGREPMPLQVARGCVFCCVRFSPDGATLAAAGRDAEGGTVILWDTETGRQRRTLKGHETLVTRVSFSPDGQALASGGADNTIKLWEPATGQLLGTLEGHTGVIFDVRFSLDGKTLASASLDKTVKLWDVASREMQITLTGHADYVCSVAFSPDGKTLASAGYDNKVKLWQVSSGEQLATLTGHDASIWQLVFSPDGKILASASLDRTIRLWRAATEKEVLLSDRAASIATATDGQQRQIVSDLEKLLAIKGGKGLRLADVSRAVSTARALEEAGNRELGASAYRELAETIAGSQDEKLSRMSETWEGIARRLALVGNEIKLEGSLADGAPLDWAAYQGKVVLAVFWPTWCNLTELSIVRKNHELYRDRGFDVVVFDIGSDRKSLEDYLEREQIEWAVVSAGKEKPEGPSAIYGVDQIPTSILIDGQGHVVSLDARGRRLDKLLEQLLGPPFAPKGN
jgi:WD40 repeat protein